MSFFMPQGQRRNGTYRTSSLLQVFKIEELRVWIWFPSRSLKWKKRRTGREVLNIYRHEVSVNINHHTGTARLTASPGLACADRSCDGEAAAVRSPPWT